MKLILKKPLREVSIKNLKIEPNEQKHKLKFVDNTYKINNSREKAGLLPTIANKRLAYSLEAKEIIKKCPGLLDAINKIANNPNSEIQEINGINKFGDKFRFKIIKSRYITSFTDKELKIKASSNLTNIFYKLIIEVNGKETKLFGKYTDSHFMKYSKVSAFNESTALSRVQKLGLRIVKPYLGYYDASENRSFMFYEYKNMANFRTLSDILNSYAKKDNTSLIGFKEINLIKQELSVISQNHGFEDMDLRNIMIDIKTKKLYLFDMTDYKLIKFEHKVDDLKKQRIVVN